MNLAITRQLRRVKQFHADRAEEDMRRRQAALDMAISAAATVSETLRSWQAGMPLKISAIYATVLGRTVSVAELDEVRQHVVALREHEQLLQNRQQEAQEAVRAAQAMWQAAHEKLRLSRRNLQKFDELIETLQKLAWLEAERQDENVLEEAAEQRRDGLTLADDVMNDDPQMPGGEDEWNQAVA